MMAVIAQEAETPRLISQWVFIDTQAYIRQRYDWHGPVMEALMRIATSKQIQILTTPITRREVLHHIDEDVEKLAPSVKKFPGLLRAAGVNTSNLGTIDEWKTSARAAFENFLLESDAVELKLEGSLEELFNAYFDVRPPFSGKKKNEFPDAGVITTLRAFAKAHAGVRVYIVSGDPDFKAACAHFPEFIHVEAVSDLVSLATASRAFHAKIEAVFRGSSELRDKLASQLLHMPASTPVDDPSRFRPGVLTADGSVTKATVTEIENVRLLDVDETEIAAEIEFRAEVTMDLLVEDGRYPQVRTKVTPIQISQDEHFSAFAYIDLEGPANSRSVKISHVELIDSFVALIGDEVAAYLD